MRTWKRRRAVALIGLAAAVALTVSACSSGGSGSGNSAGSATDVSAALKQGGTITVWAWEPTLKPVVASFEKAYPKVKVKLVNAGTAKDEYTALQNVIKAGSGVPDVAQIEYYALPQFALAKSVTELSSFGASSLQSKFTPGPWGSVHYANGIYGLPMDSGPMAMFYNKTIFTKYHLPVPTTWAQFAADARKLHAADSNAYITNDTGDAGFTTSMIWQAGGKPFKVSGTKVTVNLTTDPGTKKFTSLWGGLVSQHLLAPITSWTDQWYQGLGNGSIATLVTGAWMPANLESGVPSGSGKWAVAPMPQWTPAAHATAENGGSSLAIPSASNNKALAYAFLKYADVQQGVQIRVDGGAFPATSATLNSAAFQDKKVPYFGGQQIDKVLAQAAADVVPGWSYLPYQVYANSIFNDSVGPAYSGKESLPAALVSWQAALVKYGKAQGFTMSG